ncbi:unnamed protein product [Adineta steineri]|uniref:Cadherin domain-containing protein n=2 Tax=Adineta steineri TaxID=433720 RepID=A0A819JLY3_9BILA|nr:unnamed protein product [Adineta steineri]
MNIIFFLFLIIYPNLIKTLQEYSIEISVKEEQENGTIIIDLFSYIPTLTNSNGYLIKFVRPCQNLYIDNQNHNFIRSFKIDREEICPYEINCSLNCNLFLQKSKEEMKLIKLKINIEDINDNKAKFKRKFYSYELDENLSLNYHLQLEQAEDKDLFSKNFYSLNISSSSSSFPFELNYNEENHLLELILIHKLDKNIKKYSFELIVNDHENEIDDKCSIELTILFNQQLNSFPPEFEFKSYKFIIYNFNQTFIGQVKIKNSKENNPVYYRLISSSSSLEENFNLFQINEKTGQISFKENIFETKNLNEISSYKIFIEAFYLNYLSSLTTVEIYFNFTNSFLQQQNQNYFIEILIPKLFQKKTNLDLNSNEIFLKENLTNLPLTILQLFISTSSSSSSFPSLFNISMNSTTLSSTELNSYFYLKQISDDNEQKSFELILKKSFDYEIIKLIHLDFILNQNNFTRKSLTIFIENINDCQPTFNQTQFRFQIKESFHFPFLLYSFQAQDQDDLNNIQYYLKTKDENTFAINSTNGQFSILKSFDREIKSNYSLFICAFDQIYETCSSIFIEILDENDNICQFNSSSITLTINENLPPDTFLIQIQAFDLDLNEYGKLFYSFSTNTTYLKINSINGIIQTTKHLFDYELIQKYSILIKSCDNINSLPSLCCYLQLNINLIDLNDNLPYLTYPSSSSTDDLFIINYTNKIMPRLKAFDNDIQLKNRFIFYFIIGGSLNSSITIDYYSGQLNLLTSKSNQLPIYGTLIISISSQTNISLTILIHDYHTDPQTFIMSLKQQQQQDQSSSLSSILSPLFYFISSISLSIFILLFIFLTFFYFYLKQKTKQQNNSLINTPSTTTLSARSLSTNKKIYETYYSFGDTVHQDIIHL